MLVKVKTLEQRHPGHDHKTLARYRALFEGGECWREHLDHWLPQNAKEPTDLYEDRKKRAVYHNHVAGICGLFASYLFSEPPKLSGLEDDYWQDIVGDCDRQGSPWARWWRQRFLDALVGKTAWCWVNAPAKPEDAEIATRADEEKAGLDKLYLVPLTAEEMLDWGEDSAGNLKWVLFRQVTQERPDPTKERTTVYRWTAVDATSIRRWEWVATEKQKTPTDQDEATELPSIAHGMGEIPVTRLELPTGIWALELLHDPAVAHIRARNDLTWALHRSAHAMPFIKRKIGSDDPVVGHGYYWNLGPEDEVGFVEPAGTSYKILAEDVGQLKDELYRVIHQMASSVEASKGQQSQSGDSKAADWQSTDIVMSAYADLVRGVMLETARKMARIRGEDDASLQVAGLDGWQTEDLVTFLNSVALAREASKMSITFRKKVAEREAERILGADVSDEDMQTIRDEIDDYEEPDPMELGVVPPAKGTPTPGQKPGGVPPGPKVPPKKPPAAG